MSGASRPTEVSGPPAATDDGDPAFERLLLFLKDSRSFDFTGYKRASLIRRVRYQMQRVGVSSFDDYHEYLELHPDEFTALFNTILINVTSFFRDSDAWNYLQESVLPAVLESAGDGPIRAWSAGCATGEEAYGLAMVLAEQLGIEEFRVRVKIYATDVDEDALAAARQAIYSEKDLVGVPENFREKYFEPSNGRFAFRKDLRRCVIFGRNDLIQDAPISRIDLLACRNTLMYFNAETQTRIINRLGFALKPKGVLFLGKAEMLLNHAGQFEPIDLKRRFFHKLASPDSPSGDRPAGLPSSEPVRHLESDRQLASLRADAFMTSPLAEIVVDLQDRLRLVNHRAAALLGLSDRDLGRPFQDLDVSFRPAELRSQLGAVRATQLPVRLHEVPWSVSPTDELYVDIQLIPLGRSRSEIEGVAIIFQDVTRFRRLQDELESANRQLETAYEELQSSNEELETTNEELQSSNEELETTNEELQSTNEELETMNEELQSMNDELQSTNEELRERTTEVTALNQFMESVMASLTAAVVVVDRELIVKVWSGQAEDLWGLREDETVGAHLLKLDSGLPTQRVGPMVREVVAGREPSASAEMTVLNRRGRSVQLHVSVTPVIGSSDQPAGALLVMEATPAESAHG